MRLLTSVAGRLVCSGRRGLRRLLAPLAWCLRLHRPLLQGHPPTAAVRRVVVPARLPELLMLLLLLLLLRWLHCRHRLRCR